MQEWTGAFEMVNPRLIVVDHRYQRPQKHDLIAAISASPNWEAFGVPVCFKRDNGVYYCADGQQRILGILASEEPPKLVPVISFAISSYIHEAEVFVRINEYRKALTAYEKHNGKVVAKEPMALALERAVNKAGFSIGQQRSARSVSAIAGLHVVYNLIGEEGVVQTLVQIREAWPDDAQGLDTNILRIIAEIIYDRQSNGGYVRQKLTTALARTSPAQLFREAEAIHFAQGTSKRESLRRAFKSLAKV